MMAVGSRNCLLTGSPHDLFYCGLNMFVAGGFPVCYTDQVVIQ